MGPLGYFQSFAFSNKATVKNPVQTSFPTRCMSINTVKFVKWIPKVAFPSIGFTLPLSRALTSKPWAVGSLMDVIILHTLEGTGFSQCRKPTLKTLALAEETNLSF